MGRLRDEHAQRDYDDLMVALGKCAQVLPILQALMWAQPGYGPRASTIGRHAPESKEPWAPEAANAHWAIFFGSRFLADEMRISLGLGAGHWPNSQNGLESVAGCASIANAVVLRKARVRVDRWLDQALRIRDIDVEDRADRWVPVPREAGTAAPECPYCATVSLRFNRARGEVRCTFPGCADSAGNPTRARMEFVGVAGEGTLVFGDDQTLTFRSAA